MIRRLVCVLLALLCGIGGLAAASGAPSSPSRPSWCQQGWECVPTQELADATEQIIRLKAQVDQQKVRHLFHELGVEYLPGKPHATAYGLMGLRFGPVSAWGGFFGDAPTLGVGYNW